MSFSDGTKAMAGHCLCAIKLVEDGRWTIVQMKLWLEECLDDSPRDISKITEELKPNENC